MPDTDSSSTSQDAPAQKKNQSAGSTLEMLPGGTETDDRNPWYASPAFQSTDDFQIIQGCTRLQVLHKSLKMGHFHKCLRFYCDWRKKRSPSFANVTAMGWQDASTVACSACLPAYMLRTSAGVDWVSRDGTDWLFHKSPFILYSRFFQPVWNFVGWVAGAVAGGALRSREALPDWKSWNNRARVV